MAFNIGINVVETEGKSTPAVAGAPTSVTGMLLRSRRGPTNQAVRVSNFQQFVTRFGSYDTRFVGAYGVEGFFQNGGREAYVARVVGSGSVAASVTLEDRAGSSTLTVSAGYRGSTEPGTWGNDLYVRVTDNPTFSTPLVATLAGNQPARLQGNALGATLNLSPLPGPVSRTLTIDVDNPATRFVVTLDDSTLPVPVQANTPDVVDAINAQAGARLVAQVVGNGILLISRAKGDASQITVVSGMDDDTRNLLGFPDGSDGNVTAAGAASANPAYTEAQVQSIAGLEVGAFVRLDDGITSDWRQITGLVERDDGAGNPEYFVQWPEPPAAERNEYRLEDLATLATCEFNLSVLMLTPADPNPQSVETWEKVTLEPTRSNYAPLLINDAFAGSGYIVLADENPGAFNGRDVPVPGIDVRLGLATPDTVLLTRVAGVEGVDPSTGDYRGALARFDPATPVDEAGGGIACCSVTRLQPRPRTGCMSVCAKCCRRFTQVSMQA